MLQREEFSRKSAKGYAMKEKQCRKIADKKRCTGQAHAAQFYNEQLCTMHQWARWGKIAKVWTEEEIRKAAR